MALYSLLRAITLTNLHSGLGRVIRSLRIERGLKVEAFADAVGRTHLHAIELGQKSPTLQTLVAIGHILDISVSNLLLLSLSAELGADPQQLRRQDHRELDQLIRAGLVVVPTPSLQDLQGGVRRKQMDDLRAQVMACREKGLSKAETTRFLKIARTTLDRYWPAESSSIQVRRKDDR